MRKAHWIMIVAAFLAGLGTATTAKAEVDLTGTWIGTATIPEQGDDKIHCVIQKKGTEYSAVFNDSLGNLVNAESYAVEYRAETLVIKVTVPGNYGDLDVTVTLKVSEETLEGSWFAPGNQEGSIILKRQQ